MTADNPSMPPASRGVSHTADVTVLGAGVVGMATAYAAVQRGFSVQLIDRSPGPGEITSFANGAQLSYAYTDALAGPGMWKQLPRLALGLDPIFRMHWRIDPDFLGWLLRFLRNTSASCFRMNTVRVLELALESRVAMHALLERHPIEFNHAMPGKLHLYYETGALDKAKTVVDLKRPYGVKQQVLSPHEVKELEPALADTEGLVGALHSPYEEVGDPHLFCTQLLPVLQKRYGLQTFFDTDVTGIRQEGDHITLATRKGEKLRSRRMIICAGMGSGKLLRKLGVRIPLMPMKGYSFTAPPGENAPNVSITDGSRKLVFCRLGNSIRVAGFAELGARDARVDAERSRLLVTLAREVMPNAARYDSIQSHWAGLRPMTPSSTPIIRRVQPGIVLNVGHGMLGWTLAMGSGRAAAALLDDK